MTNGWKSSGIVGEIRQQGGPESQRQIDPLGVSMSPEVSQHRLDGSRSTPSILLRWTYHWFLLIVAKIEG
jgi:hypothetical protein